MCVLGRRPFGLVTRVSENAVVASQRTFVSQGLFQPHQASGAAQG